MNVLYIIKVRAIVFQPHILYCWIFGREFKISFHTLAKWAHKTLYHHIAPENASNQFPSFPLWYTERTSLFGILSNTNRVSNILIAWIKALFVVILISFFGIRLTLAPVHVLLQLIAIHFASKIIIRHSLLPHFKQKMG